MFNTNSTKSCIVLAFLFLRKTFWFLSNFALLGIILMLFIWKILNYKVNLAKLTTSSSKKYQFFGHWSTLWEPIGVWVIGLSPLYQKLWPLAQITLYHLTKCSVPLKGETDFLKNVTYKQLYQKEQKASSSSFKKRSGRFSDLESW